MSNLNNIQQYDMAIYKSYFLDSDRLKCYLIVECYCILCTVYKNIEALCIS